MQLEKLMKKNKAKKWTALHIRMSRQYRPENPELPTLDPWQNTTKPPADQFVFERNPFFHRVDENGLQLPYIDKFILNVSSSSIIPAKSGAGDSDLQSVGLDFADYTFLKDAEKRYPLKVQLWKRTQGSRLALLPNLNTGDPYLAKAAAGRAHAPRAFARDQPGRDQQGGVLRPRQGKRRHHSAGKPPLPARALPTPGLATIRPRPQPCSTRLACSSAATTESVSFRMAAQHRSSSRLPAKA